MVFWAGIMEKVTFNGICATKTVQFNSLRKAIKAECNTIVIIHIRTTLFKLGNIVSVI